MTKPSGIATKFITAIILFSSVLALVGTCLQLYIDYRKDYRAITEQLSYLETSHQKSLINDIWLFNDRGIEEQLKGMLGLPMVEAVRLDRSDGEPVEVGQVKARRKIIHQIPLSHRYRGNDIHLGTLQITASGDYAYERMQERALLILITQFVQISVVAAFIFFLFYYLIGRHLRDMAHHTREVTVNTLDQPLQLHRSSHHNQRQDELDLLVGAFNQMQQQLSSYISERLQIEGQLREEIEERKRMEGILHEQAAQLEDEIAQRQRTQEELNLLNNTLEERIAATVTELRKKDELLIHQSRLAAMGELLTSIAHQWRQPLNNIAVYIQKIQFLSRSGELTQEDMDQDIAEMLEILLKMSATIDDFRTFFQRDAIKREFVLEKVVNKVVALSRSLFEEQGIRVTLEAAYDIRTVGFSNEYAQALMNILHNARDILLERQVADPQISIAIFSEAGHSVVTVRDNGGGIPVEIMPQIFDPYFTTKGPATGTGIGLYMARTLIERNMEGRLTARNVDNGAEFRIEL